MERLMAEDRARMRKLEKAAQSRQRKGRVGGKEEKSGRDGEEELSRFTKENLERLVVYSKMAKERQERWKR
jgi:hypothetical protein